MGAGSECGRGSIAAVPRGRVFQRSDFIASAMESVDELGLEGLNLRSLGTRVGASHTAIYHHFRDKDELLAALIDEALSGVVLDEAQLKSLAPRQAITTLALAVRAALAQHPRLMPAFSINGAALRSAPVITAIACDLLDAAGVAPDDVPLVYSAIESYVFGASLFDFAGAPDHVNVRRARFRMLGIEPFDAISRTTDDVAAHTEAAFHRGLSVLVDGLLPR